MVEKNLYIKHVVCLRCMELIREILSTLDCQVLEVQLGVAQIKIGPNWDEKAFAQTLKQKGFELLVDPDLQIVNQVKSAIIDLVHYQENHPSIKNSMYLAEKIGLSYSKFSKVFSEYEGITIEKYLIMQKVERIKELLSYGELSLKEIGIKLGYSSIQHISHQFKVVTGESVSEFNTHSNEHRVPLSLVGENYHHPKT